MSKIAIETAAGETKPKLKLFSGLQVASCSVDFGRHLEMVGSEDEPSAEGEAGVDEQGAEQEPQNGRKGFLQRHDEHVVGAEEAQIAQHAEPDEQVARAQQDAAHVPHVAVDVLHKKMSTKCNRVC